MCPIPVPRRPPQQGAPLGRARHRRCEALARLLSSGTKTLPEGAARISRGKMMVDAVVLGNVSRKDAAFTGFIENHERLDLSPSEQARCYVTFVNKMGFTRKELAERIPLNRVTLDCMIGALDGKALSVSSHHPRTLQRKLVPRRDPAPQDTIPVALPGIPAHPLSHELYREPLLGQNGCRSTVQDSSTVGR